jgi:poly(hydroxyalkanoate) granule-associated protein
VDAEDVMESESPSVLSTLRKLVLASIGAAVVAQDELEKFIQKMAEKGEIAEKDARKLIDEVISRRKEGFKKADAEFDKRLEQALARLNIPTKSDIEALMNQVDALSKKIEEMKKS